MGGFGATSKTVMKNTGSLATVAHACSSSYPGGRGKGDGNLKSAPG
jgi:hypothetical protein